MIKTTPWTGGTEEEYEAQHFSFGSQRIKIALRQMIEQKITNVIKNFESELQERLGLNENDQSTLTHACNKLIYTYCERAEASLNKIDSELDRVIKVPPNVLLPGDEVQAEHKSDEEYVKLKSEVAELSKRVERGALMEALLIAEVAELTSAEKACAVAKKDMAFLNQLLKKEEMMKELSKETHLLCDLVPFFKK